MNRLVLIGNGFDMAHKLETSYADFINWYWDYRVNGFYGNLSNVSKDPLCTFTDLRESGCWNVNSFCGMNLRQIPGAQMKTGVGIISGIIKDTKCFKTEISPLLRSILKGAGRRNWHGIEQDYYDLLTKYALSNFTGRTRAEIDNDILALNEQLEFLTDLLIQYLKEIDIQEKTVIPSIQEAIYAPFKEDDIAISSNKYFQIHKEYWETHEERDDELRELVLRYGLNDIQCLGQARYWRMDQPNGSTQYPDAFLRPRDIMLLNFNYTHTTEIYRKTPNSFRVVHIHGDVNDAESVIFGYGDELDDDYKRLQSINDNDYLQHIKSTRYLENPNYHQVLAFMESAPFQVLIMGHSCGNSDRTLLNTIFEHPNCVSIKPYYYKKEDGSDDYLEKIQNISRNFTDMKLMRDRVVNKTQCEPLTNNAH